MKRLCASILLLAFAGCPSTQPCSEATCDGCCTATGECAPGTSTSACGAGALACVECLVGAQCMSGLCLSPMGTGGGGGTATGGGGGSATGGGGASGDAGIARGWQAMAPDQREGACLATDPLSGALLLIGGRREYADPGRADVWQWNGQAWTELHPATTPPSGGPCVNDLQRGRVVLYPGGDETWEWDGTSWTAVPQHPATALTGFALTWDDAQHRTLLFGGRTASGDRSSALFAWDGATWSSVAQLNPPTARDRPALATHAPSGKVLVSGGFEPSQTAPTSGLWGFDGASWSSLSGDPAYDTGETVAMVWAPGRQRTVLVHGRLTQLAEFDGAIVTERSATTTDGAISLDGAGIALAAWDGAVVMHGAAYLPESQVLWRLEGQQWSPLQSLPQRRWGAGVAWLPGQDRFIVAGGTVESTRYPPTFTRATDAWSFDGQQWSLLDPSGAPACDNCVGATEPLGPAVAVLGFGPFGPGVLWRYDGAHWTPFPSTGLDETPSSIATVDGKLGALVRGRLLTFDGTQWTARDQLGAANKQAALGYEPTHQRFVQFGGISSTTTISTDETWTLESGATQWTKVTTASSPPPCSATTCSLQWLPEEDALVLFTTLGLFRFDGTTWTQLDEGAVRPQVTQFGVAREPAQGRVFLFGGASSRSTGTTALNQGWWFTP